MRAFPFFKSLIRREKVATSSLTKRDDIDVNYIEEKEPYDEFYVKKVQIRNG